MYHREELGAEVDANKETNLKANVLFHTENLDMWQLLE